MSENSNRWGLGNTMSSPKRFFSKLRGNRDSQTRVSQGDLRECQSSMQRELQSDEFVLSMGLHRVADVDVISSGGIGQDSHFLRRFAVACLRLRKDIDSGKLTVVMSLECLAPLTALVSFIVSKTPKLGGAGSQIEDVDWFDLQSRLGVVRSNIRLSAARVHFYTSCATDPMLIDCDAEAIACIGAVLMIAKSISVLPLSRMLAAANVEISRGALDVRLFGSVHNLRIYECDVDTVVGECDPTEIHLVQSKLLTDASLGVTSDSRYRSSWLRIGGSLRGLYIDKSNVSSDDISPLCQTLSSIQLSSCRVIGPDNVLTLSKVHDEMSHSAWLRLVEISAVKCNVSALHPSIQLAVSLVRLDLSFNSIEEVHPELSECQALREVSLRHNRLFDVTDLSSALTNVTTLDLSHNDIVSVWALAELEHLQSLDISSNRLRFWSDLGHLSRRCLNIKCISFRENPLCSPQYIFANDVNKLGIALFQKPTRFASASSSSHPMTSSVQLLEPSLSPLRRSNASELGGFGRATPTSSCNSSLVSVNGVSREMSPKEANALLDKYELLLAVNDGVLTSLDVLEDVRVERREAKKPTEFSSSHPLTPSPTERTQFSSSEPKVDESPIQVSNALFPDTVPPKNDNHLCLPGSTRSIAKNGDSVVTRVVSTRREERETEGVDGSPGVKKVTIVKRIVKKTKKKPGPRLVTVNALPNEFDEVPRTGALPTRSSPNSIQGSFKAEDHIDPVTGDRPDLPWLVSKYGNTRGFQRYTELTDGLINRGPLNELLTGTMPEKADATDAPCRSTCESDDEYNAGDDIVMSSEPTTVPEDVLLSETPEALGKALGTFLDSALLPFLREATVHHESPGVKMTIFAVEQDTAPIPDQLEAVADNLDVHDYFTTGASFSAMANVGDDFVRDRRMSFAERNPLALYRGGNIWEAEFEGINERPKEVWLSSTEKASVIFAPVHEEHNDAPSVMKYEVGDLDAESEDVMLETNSQRNTRDHIEVTPSPSSTFPRVKLTRSSNRYVGMVLIRVDRFESDYHVGFAIRSKTVTEDTLVSSFQRPVLTSVHYCPWARGQSDSVVRATNVRVVSCAESKYTRKSAMSTLEGSLLSKKESRLSGDDASSVPVVWGEVGPDSGSYRVPQVVLTEAQVAESSAAHSVPTPSRMVVGFVVEPHLAKSVMRCLIKRLHAYRDPNYVSQHLDWPLFTSGADESDLQLPRFRGCARKDDVHDDIVASGVVFRGIVETEDVESLPKVDDPMQLSPLGTGIVPIDFTSASALFSEDSWCASQRETLQKSGMEVFDIAEPPATRLSVPIILAPRRLICSLLSLMFQVTSKALTETVGMTRPGVEFRIQPDEIGIHVRSVLMPSGTSELHVDPSATQAARRGLSASQLKFAFCNATVISSNSITGIRDNEEFAAFIVVLKDTFCVFRDMNYRGSDISNADDLFEPILTYSVADLEFVGISFGYTHLILNFGAGTSEIILFFREISSLAQVLTYLREVSLVTTTFMVLPLPESCYEQVATMTGCHWERPRNTGGRVRRAPVFAENEGPSITEDSTSSLEVVGYSSCFVAQLAYSFDATGLQVVSPPATNKQPTASEKPSYNDGLSKQTIVTRVELDTFKSKLMKGPAAIGGGTQPATKYQPRASHLGGLGDDDVDDDPLGESGMGGTLRNFFSTPHFTKSKLSDRNVGVDDETEVKCDIGATFPLRHFPALSTSILPSGWERCSFIFSKPRYHVCILQENYLTWAGHLRGEGTNNYAAPIASFPVDDILKVEVSPRLANLPLLVVVYVNLRGHTTAGGSCDRFLLCFQHLRQIDQFLGDLTAFHRACISHKESVEREQQEKAQEKSPSSKARKQLVSAASVLFDDGKVDGDGGDQGSKKTIVTTKKLNIVQLEAHPSTELGAIGPCELMLAALGKR